MSLSLFYRKYALLGAVVLGTSFIVSISKAQPAVPPVTPEPPTRETGALALPPDFIPVVTPDGAKPLYALNLLMRNIRPSLAAYWLDPAHNTAPIELSLSKPTNGQINQLSRLPGNANGPLGLKLPEGVESVTPIDPQNRLLARGTAEGLKALQKLVPTFDVPLVQYEVEARFFQLDADDLPKTGLKFQSAGALGSVASAPRDLNDRLKQLVDNNRAKVVTAPRVLVIDGLEARLQHVTNTPVVVDESLARQALPQTEPNLKANSEPLPGVATMTSIIGLSAIVLRRPNDLTSLWITPTYDNRSLPVTITIPEEQPFAIQMSSAQDKERLIVIVTSRRVRREGE